MVLGHVRKLLIAGGVVLAVLQVVRPTIPSPAATAELRAPTEIKRVLEKDCYSCHSDRRRLSWFDEIVPAYWLVRHDILTAREHLNFSTLGSKSPAVQRSTLYEAVNMIRLGSMPLPSFVALHPAAKTTPEELAAFMEYLAPWSPASADLGNPLGNASARNKAVTGEAQAIAPDGAIRPVSLAVVLPELDGFPFDPSFEGWKPISTTDRGDNNTFRFILGNDIAVQAAESGNISPWPDGTRFAKIAWQQERGADGLVHPGKFVQVELMLKDARRYRNSDGWGWGRWRGSELRPYGQDAQFVTECTSCHLPMRRNDFVYTLPITTAIVGGDAAVNKRAAALPANLLYQPLRWSAITMYVDPKNRTTATLYGNDVAIQAVRASNTTGTAPVYPAGSVIALVTWAQRDDSHWFGARIPDAPQSVEFVQVAAGGPGSSYRRFVDSGLKEVRSTADAAALRMSFVLDLAPAQLP
jgi:hypothetical protein